MATHGLLVLFFSARNLDNFIDEQFVIRFPCCNFLTISMLSYIVIAIPTTTRNQTYCPCDGMATKRGRREEGRGQSPFEISGVGGKPFTALIIIVAKWFSTLPWQIAIEWKFQKSSACQQLRHNECPFFVHVVGCDSRLTRQGQGRLKVAQRAGTTLNSKGWFSKQPQTHIQSDRNQAPRGPTFFAIEVTVS